MQLKVVSFLSKMAAHSSKFSKEQIDMLIERASKIEQKDLEEMRKECQFNVRVQRMIPPSQMEKKSEYEKKRIDNINRSMTLKYSIGKLKNM